VSPAPPPSDPYRTITVDVEGPRADELLRMAVKQAATFLNEDEHDLYAYEIGQAYVVERSKYRRHLGEQGHPLRWRATVRVRLLAAVVRQRREDGPEPPSPGAKRGHLRSAT
jgi:hypothetical protein